MFCNWRMCNCRKTHFLIFRLFWKAQANSNTLQPYTVLYHSALDLMTEADSKLTSLVQFFIETEWPLELLWPGRISNVFTAITPTCLHEAIFNKNKSLLSLEDNTILSIQAKMQQFFMRQLTLNINGRIKWTHFWSEGKEHSALIKEK